MVKGGPLNAFYILTKVLWITQFEAVTM